MRHKSFYGLLGAAAAVLFATTSLTPPSLAQAPGLHVAGTCQAHQEWNKG
jgi:hypothetical protein